MSKKNRTPTFFLVLGSFLLGVIVATAIDGALKTLVAFAYFATVTFAGLGVLSLLVLLATSFSSRSHGE